VESWLAEMIQQGGPEELSVLYLGGPAVAISLLHAVWPKKWAAIAGACLVGLMLVIGVGGYFEGRSRTNHGVEMMSSDARNTPQDLADMRERGYLEALRPLQFAGVFAGACGVLLLVGELRRRSRRRAS
jgi:drug/metabolite transporter (DMT)-like permease